MKALVKEKPEPGMIYKDVPDPAPQPGQVVIRVKACGIAGSEVARYRWTRPHHAGQPKDMTRLLPRIMGHEFSGTVVSAGAGVVGVKEGDAVVVQSVIGCGSCESCDAGFPNHCHGRRSIGLHLDGGFAEYAAIPANNVYAVPDGLSLERVALLQPFAIGTYSTEVGGLRPGDRIGVWGVGQVGLSIIQNAQLAGATVEFAVGRDLKRLNAVRAMGIPNTISVNDTDPQDVLLKLFMMHKLDLVFEASGNVLAITSALPILKRQGKVVVVGNVKEPLHVDLLQAIMDQISILTVRTYSLSAWRRALALIGRVLSPHSELPQVTVPLVEGLKAFERAAAGEGVKFMIDPTLAA